MGIITLWLLHFNTAQKKIHKEGQWQEAEKSY